MEEEISLFESEVAAITEFAKKEKINLNTQNEIGRLRILIQAKKGDWLDDNFPSKRTWGVNEYSAHIGQHDVTKMPATGDESAAARTIHRMDALR